MTKPFAPLLAAPADLKRIEYGNVWLSAKLDGIRAIVIDGVVVSRSLKPIRNRHVQKLFGHLEHYDGELICGDPTAKDCYLKTNSAVMSADGEPDVTFHVFDHVEQPCDEYFARYKRLAGGRYVQVVVQHSAENETALLDLEQWLLGKGYEGVMLRAHSGPQSFYKYGRSTAREGTLLKLKRFTDSEATVIGVEEEMQNNNEATKDALGRTERSSHKENLVGKGRLGALICETKEGIRFNIGTGFDAATRVDLWQRRETLPGMLAKFKHFEIGQKEAPRFPVFLGWRDPIDA